jgi:hypothetical protein
VFDARRAAAAEGLAVELADLGDWAGRLISEYDPESRAIRINGRALDAYRRHCGELDSSAVRTFIDLAVAHELYHHGESRGDVERLPTRPQREAAANAYARARVPVEARLAAFLERETAS